MTIQMTSNKSHEKSSLNKYFDRVGEMRVLNSKVDVSKSDGGFLKTFFNTSFTNQ